MAQLRSSGIREAIIVFNLLPATYADPSWIDAYAPWHDRLANLKSPVARSVLSQWLLARNGLADCYDFEFREAEKALFLLDARELKLLCAKIGMMRHRQALRRMISGGVLAQLGKEVGEGQLREALVMLPIPESLPPPDADFLHASQQLMPQLIASGLPWVLALLRPEWRAVSLRARLKFGREHAGVHPLSWTDDERASALQYLDTYLLKRMSS